MYKIRMLLLAMIIVLCYVHWFIELTDRLTTSYLVVYVYEYVYLVRLCCLVLTSERFYGIVVRSFLTGWLAIASQLVSYLFATLRREKRDLVFDEFELFCLTSKESRAKRRSILLPFCHELLCHLTIFYFILRCMEGLLYFLDSLATCIFLLLRMHE